MRRSVGVLVVVAGLVLPLTGWAVEAFAAQPATWNFRQAGVPGAQPLGNYGKGVLVAVVDTWVDPNQPEFGGRVVDEADCLPGTCQDHRYAPDSCVHGTHVAGTIASADYGVAPEADILAVQVLSGPSGSANPSAECSGSADVVATGIDFAVTKGARVINLSIGDEVPGLFQSSAITTAVQNAFDHGVAVVFAAGNDGVPLTDSYGNDALLVAATGPSGQLASYTDFNSAVSGSVNVAAPGGDTGNSSSCSTTDCILSTFPDKQLGLLEGTSMAAPHVSGLAALLVAQNPSRGVANVYSTIENTASPLAGAGSGLMDAQKALEVEAASHPFPSSAPAATTAPAKAASPRPASAPSTGTTPAPSTGSGQTSSIGAAIASAGESGGSTPTVATLPSVNATKTAGLPAPTAGVTATAPRRTAVAKVLGRPARSSDWIGHNAGILVVACLLLAAVVLGLLWSRESRRLFANNRIHSPPH